MWLSESLSGVLFKEYDESVVVRQGELLVSWRQGKLAWGVSELSTTVWFKKEDCLSCFHAFPRFYFFFFRGVRVISDLFYNTDELYMAGLTTWDKFKEDEKEVDSITDELNVSADKYNFCSSNKRLKAVWICFNTRAELFDFIALIWSSSRKINFWVRNKMCESDSGKKRLGRRRKKSW